MGISIKRKDFDILEYDQSGEFAFFEDGSGIIRDLKKHKEILEKLTRFINTVDQEEIDRMNKEQALENFKKHFLYEGLDKIHVKPGTGCHYCGKKLNVIGWTTKKHQNYGKKPFCGEECLIKEVERER